MTREKGPTVIKQKGPTSIWGCKPAGVTEGARRATEVTPAKAVQLGVHLSIPF
jgi:metal-dependent hydrolase (beta-lactamase superfamily II)